MGKITETSPTGNPVDGATVVINSKGYSMQYFTNEAGIYYASNIPAGNYEVTVSFMGKTATEKEIIVTDGETKEVNFVIAAVQITTPSVIITHSRSKKPLLNVFDPTVQFMDKMELRQSGMIKVSDVVAIQAGVTDIDGNYYVRGSRSGGMLYFIDGCKVMGNPNVPVCGVELFKTYTNFIPAKYGDTTGGVAVIETRNWFTE